MLCMLLKLPSYSFYIYRSSLSFLNGVNAKMKQHSQQQWLFARRHARGSTNSNNACTVPCETKCEHATPLVPLEQSAIKTIPTLWNDATIRKEGKTPQRR